MVTTPLAFSIDTVEMGLGDYISSALSSLASIWYIPAGLIIASGVLIMGIKMLSTFSGGDDEYPSHRSLLNDPDSSYNMFPLNDHDYEMTLGQSDDW